WSSFTSVPPPALEKRFRLRRRPFDAAWQGPVSVLKARGERLARLLPPYDQAMRILARAPARLDHAAIPREVRHVTQ
ncbi:MAG: hypothetical protein ACYTDU_18765, partial [Planctomycetota bacterium]